DLRDSSPEAIMRWFKPVKNSIYGLLGQQVNPTESVLDGGTEDIRETMLGLLGDDGPKNFPHITRRIRYAADIQALWYLRGDLMGARSQSTTASRRKPLSCGTGL